MADTTPAAASAGATGPHPEQASAELFNPSADPATEQSQGQARNPTAGIDEDDRTYASLGVTPYLSAESVPPAFQPLQRRLAYPFNKSLRIRTASSPERFDKRLEAGRDDIVIIDAGSYELALAHHYLPLARQELPLKAYIVVPIDSKLSSLNDLRNHLVATPAASTPITRLTKQTLTHAGLRPGSQVIIKHLRTEEACLREMLRGAVDACATSKPTLRVMQDRLQTKFRVLTDSDALPGLVFAAHDRLPPELRQQLQKMLLQMTLTANGLDLLRQAGLGPWVPIDPQAYRTAITSILDPR